MATAKYLFRVDGLQRLLEPNTRPPSESQVLGERKIDPRHAQTWPCSGRPEAWVPAGRAARNPPARPGSSPLRDAGSGGRQLKQRTEATRTGTHPQAPAPDPHVPLLHYVIKIGSHPGRPAGDPLAPAHAPGAALGRAEGRVRGGVGAGRKLERGSCLGCGSAWL